MCAEAEVKKRKGLEIDKTRLEREILELQRRVDRERTKREELESTLESTNGMDSFSDAPVTTYTLPT